MRLLPRHYLYLVAIAGLGVYNGVRLYRARHAAPTAVTASLAQTRGTSPVWAAFDAAAQQRDAVDTSFQPALQTLTQQLDAATAPQTSAAELVDLRGCRTWLLFYRQDFLHPAADKPGWRAQTLQHVTSCSTSHRDLAQ